MTIWLEEDSTFDVRVTEGSAWVWAPGGVTIHTIEGTTGLEDLKVLATFFRKGLEAIIVARREWTERPLPGLEKADA